MKSLVNHLELELLEASHGTFGSSWSRSALADPYTRLYLIHAGSAIIEHHKTVFTMRPGWFYVIPANSSLAFHCPDTFTVSWIHIHAKLLGGMDFFQWLPGVYAWEVDDFASAQSWFDELIALKSSEILANELKKQSIILQLIALYAKRADTNCLARKLAIGTRFKEVFKFIDKKLPAQIKVDELAHIACLETTYFATRFKDCFGMSPRDYILSKRIESTRFLLLTSDMKLSEIALECGFCDSYHLSKMFKKKVGVSPREFRQENHFDLPMP